MSRSVSSEMNVHPGFLHIALIETLHSGIVSSSDALRDRIHKRRDSLGNPRRIKWVEELEPAPLAKSPHYLCPRVYGVWGTFDLGAIYLSPDMRVYTYTDDLAFAGQSLDVCVLPVKPAEVDGSDFNQEFIQAYSGPRKDDLGSSEQRPDFRYFCAVRLKLNPAASWPSEPRRLSETSNRHRTILNQTWSMIATWLSKGTEMHHGRHAALGFCVGWNEVMAVAHACSPGDLFDLVLDLRQAVTPVPSKEGELCRAHLFETSFSTFGCDVQIMRETQQELERLETKKGAKPFGPEELFEVSQHVAARFQGDPKRENNRCYLRPSYHVYPGRERLLLERLKLVQDWWRPRRPSGRFRWYFEIGKQDVHGPLLYFDDLGGATATVAYLTAMFSWLEEAVATEGAQPGSGASPPFFDTYTRFGRYEPQPDTLANIHKIPVQRFDVRSVCPAVRKVFDRAIDPLKVHLRTLQISYETTDRVMILANAVTWAWRREVPSDESVELIPAFLCLRAAIEDHVKWWNERSLKPLPTGSRSSWEFPRLSPPDATYREARQRLETLNAELRTLFNAFRTSFSNRHLTSYILGDLADLNLRFRGSFHQILSVANMVVDALVGLMIGNRACMAGIGTVTAPEVGTALDAILVDLPANALSQPLLLESVAHEVGHELLRELIAAGDGGGWPRHRWKRWCGSPMLHDRLVELIERLDAEVFLGRLAKEKSFLESTSDFIEYQSLKYEDFFDWVWSFTLRAVLSMPAVHQDNYLDRRKVAGRSDPEPEVPQLGPDSIDTVLERIVLVAVANELLDWNPEMVDFEEFRTRLEEGLLRDLREFLFRKCIIGPTWDAYMNLSTPEEWERFISSYIFDLPAKWLEDQKAAEVAAEFFKALRQLINRDIEADEISSAHLKGALAEAMAEYRQVLRSRMMPSLHVRHNLKGTDGWKPETLPEPSAPATWSERPYKAVRQPLKLHYDALHGSSEIATRYRSLVGQRGLIVLLRQEDEDVVAGAISRFYLKQMELLPAWRRGVAEMMDEIERRSEESDS